uniref:Uncharacterized protein n=1 Tax=Romanomermis culicivorax TaxID=13658 RepID=A0A915KCC4_ROMCU
MVQLLHCERLYALKEKTARLRLLITDGLLHSNDHGPARFLAPCSIPTVKISAAGTPPDKSWFYASYVESRNVCHWSSSNVYHHKMTSDEALR